MKIHLYKPILIGLYSNFIYYIFEIIYFHNFETHHYYSIPILFLISCLIFPMLALIFRIDKGYNKIIKSIITLGWLFLSEIISIIIAIVITAISMIGFKESLHIDIIVLALISWGSFEIVGTLFIFPYPLIIFLIIALIVNLIVSKAFHRAKT